MAWESYVYAYQHEKIGAAKPWIIAAIPPPFTWFWKLPLWLYWTRLICFFFVAQQLTPHTLNIILRIDEMASFKNKNKISIWGGGGGGREDKNCHVKQIFRKLKLTKNSFKEFSSIKRVIKSLMRWWGLYKTRF